MAKQQNCINNLAQSLKTEICFSQTTGNDTFGLGTEIYPYATINKAVAVAGTNAGTTLRGLDSATYPENVSLTIKLNIYAPGITVAPTSGDAFTIFDGASDPYPNIVVGSILPVAGNCVTVPGGAGNNPTVTAINQMVSQPGYYVCANGQGGQTTLSAPTIIGDITNTGGGTTSYACQFRNGTDDSGTYGTVSNFLFGIAVDPVQVTQIVLNPPVYAQGLVFPTPTLTFTALASAGLVALVEPVTATAQYVIDNIKLNGVGATDFAGGDRDISITDGTNVWTDLPALTLTNFAGNGQWGDTAVGAAVPSPTGVSWDQASQPGAPIYAQYSGGTTDYTSGSVKVTLRIIQVVQ